MLLNNQSPSEVIVLDSPMSILSAWDPREVSILDAPVLSA